VSGGYRVLEDYGGAFLADHDRGGVGVAPGHLRHDRGVGDTEPLDAMGVQAGIDNRVDLATIRQVPTGCRLKTPRTGTSSIIWSSVCTSGPGKTSALKGLERRLRQRCLPQRLRLAPVAAAPVSLRNQASSARDPVRLQQPENLPMPQPQ
jgi:hypothetical protein